MGRLVAIDYGTKRTGIAVTDTLQIIANGLTTVPTHNIFGFLKEYFEKEPVDCIVIGYPKQTNNQPSENLKNVISFKNKLKKLYPLLKIEFFDERFTSVMAHRVMIDGGLKKKDRANKALVDEISAVILLQSYMESKHYNEQK